MARRPSYDVAVIGAGIFGAWTAWHLRRAGCDVILLDAYGAASGRASSGGESRIIRIGYGTDELYSRMSLRSLKLWQAFFRRIGQPLFQRTGMLWLARAHDQHPQASLRVLTKLNVAHERLSRAELRKRYPQFALEQVDWALYEPESGAILARRAVQALVAAAAQAGVEYEVERVTTPGGRRKLESVVTSARRRIHAGAFVFACGPWLPKVFANILRNRIFPTRQEVFFLGTPAGDRRFTQPAMPAWYDIGAQAYGIPDLENRGFKLAFDAHGASFDPDDDSRLVSAPGLSKMRAYVARRFPLLRHAPLVETRVCQYENTSSGDFLLDRHPDWPNVWLVGGGSGHGFKHGPAVGEYVAARVIGRKDVIEPRFSLESKARLQSRQVV